MASQAGEVTLLLRRLNAGEQDAESELYSIVYSELRRVAGHYMRSEREGNTLQPTALVHEAYIRLLGTEAVEYQNRGHFKALACRAMRRVLVDHARARGAEKRGGDLQKVTFDDIQPRAAAQFGELLAVHEALDKLASIKPRQVQVVEMRYFGGLTVEETAEALGVSEKTVKRDWSLARLWLFKEITGTSS